MAFHVFINNSKDYVLVEEGKSILEAAKNNQISLPHSCNNGRCSKCKCKVIVGSYDMQEYSINALSETEKSDGYILTCKTYPLSDMFIQYDYQERNLSRVTSKVISIEKICIDIAVIKMKLYSNKESTFIAGQYFDFIMKNGKKRSYSIANSPSRDGFVEFHIRHLPGGLFTDYVFGMEGKCLKEKEILYLEGPLGTCDFQVNGEKPVIFLATGTGFAPIKSMMEEIIYKNINRPIYFYWGVNKPVDLYMNQLVKSWELISSNFKYVPVVYDDSFRNIWFGRIGNVYEAVMEDFKDLSSFQVYACGSSNMIKKASRDFVLRSNLPKKEFYSDEFISESDLQS
ncbi:CDP-4-dehydro-6-deoxyglucose reductase [Candidatus Kinetoplastibacterium desouzaii TCC079E]|uniref:CDP-4-dehydro-6-deoxyglucose reductase n=1 Tax=Candidatus Kinetoplastidibacterium desouzai TCC079E TaxID=1208919 RepID=M1LUG9_9PROT|nr:2Fe-2S iron-sulfur cluster-binding protein [Candidatus Kinetoplastibacterium desouzaii]AGF46954.1 CDP-4-dehydro-6-deoxyglucose reductase [Candidatus Kinetoplastibacterium desouzaii TCC079E]